MNNNECITPKELVRLGHYGEYAAARNALQKVKKYFGIQPYGKVFWWQYVTIFNSGVSLYKLITIFNKANGDFQWRELKEKIKQNEI